MHPCRNFLATLEVIIPLLPDGVPIVLTDSRPEIDRVTGHWMTSTDGAFGGATILPVEIVQPFLDWCRSYVPSSYPHDDYRLSFYFVSQRLTVWHPVPSLMEHRGRKSLLGHNASESAMTPRRYIGRDDPLAIDWTDGLTTPFVSPRRAWTAKFAATMPPDLRRQSGLEDVLR